MKRSELISIMKRMTGPIDIAIEVFTEPRLRKGHPFPKELRCKSLVQGTVGGERPDSDAAWQKAAGNEIGLLRELGGEYSMVVFVTARTITYYVGEERIPTQDVNQWRYSTPGVNELRTYSLRSISGIVINTDVLKGSISIEDG